MNEKILIVDDEPHLVEVIASRLKANHYKVATAISGQEGIDKAKKEKPKLILLDILMPDMDGYQVLQRLKEAPETREVPVIILTVKKWSEDVQKALEGGAADYLAKPFTPATLLEKIEGALHHG